jgi:4-hydroxythreonine-4-phosphate dehydrogenase
VYGNAKVARQHAKTMADEFHNVQWNIIESPKQAKEGRLNMINCYGDDTPLKLGESTTEAGQAALKSLQRATADLQQGLVDALVTAPINKDNIQCDKFCYSGHTEYLTHIFGQGKESLMMMISDRMRVALACNHTPISQVSEKITLENIMVKLQLLNQTLQTDFSCRKPRIAVLALNPHAGDNGLIGKEEQEVIAPAIAQAQEQGIWAFGPYSADGFFGAGQYNHFDAVLAMYHDQGLAPFKALDMSGVNFTAGLRVVRTSPDHGTAYGIAGKNEADPQSMLHAIYTAIDVLKTREENTELLANQLIVERKEVKREYQVEKFIPID